MISKKTEFCCSCCQSLGLENSIQEKLGGGGSIDYCLECQTKALNEVLKSWIEKVPDTQIRRDLASRLMSIIKKEKYRFS